MMHGASGSILAPALLSAALVVFASLPVPVEAQPAARGDRCETCHALLPATSALVQQYSSDIHRQRGFGCADCHGGDPMVDDPIRAKDPARGFRGRLSGGAVISACARCHSDAGFMRRFAPRLRVDQAVEYATSVHGKRLADGDVRVATCASCHGSHGILRVSNARSPVFPTNVAATCAGCHSSADHMKGYTLADGSPLPTIQRAEYERSVHYQAMIKRDDLSAPTCNDCHGNHGAAPPGVGAVVNVCGTCHAVFAERFEASVHRQLFERGCVECHGNHAVLPGADEMLGTSKEANCPICHSEGDNGFVVAGQMRARIDRLKGAIDVSSELIRRVGNAGIEVSDQELAIGEARARLTLARTEVHRFALPPVDRVVQDGLTLLASVERAGQRAEAELRYRRRGLAASLGAILILLIALGLKIRAIEQRQGFGRPS